MNFKIVVKMMVRLYSVKTIIIWLLMFVIEPTSQFKIFAKPMFVFNAINPSNNDQITK